MLRRLPSDEPRDPLRGGVSFRSFVKRNHFSIEEARQSPHSMPEDRLAGGELSLAIAGHCVYLSL
jgi:hypothetical protein